MNKPTDVMTNSVLVRALRIFSKQVAFELGTVNFK